MTPGPSTPAPIRPPIIAVTDPSSAPVKIIAPASVADNPPIVTIPEFSALTSLIAGSIPRLLIIGAGVVTPVLMKWGVTADQTAGLASDLGPVVGGLVGALLSLIFSHLQITSGVPTLIAAIRLITGKPKAAAVFFLCCLTLSLTACASTESQVLNASLGTVDIADIAVDGMYTTHAINQAEARKAAALVNVAHSAVQAWNTAYQANQVAGVIGQVDTKALQAAALGAITAMNSEITAAKAATQPATKP